MSKMPGPKARPVSSTRNGICSSVPLGQTVSKWPSTRAGPQAGCPRKSAERRGRHPGQLAIDFDRAPRSRSRSASSNSQPVESLLVAAGRLDPDQLDKLRPAFVVASTQNRSSRRRATRTSLRLDRQLADVWCSDSFLDRLDAQAWTIENPDRTVIGEDRRLDNVIAIVFVRPGDIARDREARQGRRSRHWPLDRSRTRASHHTRPAHPGPDRGRGRASLPAGPPAGSP